jgi:hypothetical protein
MSIRLAGHDRRRRFRYAKAMSGSVIGVRIFSRRARDTTAATTASRAL